MFLKIFINFYSEIRIEIILSRSRYLLGGLLLLLLLLLGITLVISWCLFGDLLLLLLNLLLFLLDSNKESHDLLGLAHVVLIHLELIEDVINLSLSHLVSPSHQGVLEHLDVDLAVGVVGTEGLDDEIIGIVAISSHLVLEHVNHPLEVAGTSNLSEQIVKLSLGHEDTDVVEGSAEVVLVQGAILVDVHQLEAVLVHLDLLLGEDSLALVLTLAHGWCCLSCCVLILED